MKRSLRRGLAVLRLWLALLLVSGPGGGVAQLAQDSVRYLAGSITTGVAARAITTVGVGALAALSLRQGHAVAASVPSSGDGWGWGDNYGAELGAGGAPNYPNHFNVPISTVTSTGQPLNDVISLAAGNGHGVAALADGTV